MAPPVSEPVFGVPGGQIEQNAYSVAPGDVANRAAQAGHAAAHQVEGAQHIHNNAPVPKAKSKLDQEALAKLVAQENESKSKFPRYPGLERWQLLEKMGDGAFSNVYRARDLEGQTGEVAIKVVRKFEMNSMQVSLSNRRRWCFFCFLCPFCQPTAFLTSRHDIIFP